MNSAKFDATSDVNSVGYYGSLLQYSAILGMIWGVVCFFVGPVLSVQSFQLWASLSIACGLNVAPAIVECLEGSFTPFDPKHLFLAYFAVILTFNAIAVSTFASDVGISAGEAGTGEQIRAVALVDICLSAFLVGCYSQVPNWQFLIPRFRPFEKHKVWIVGVAALSCAIPAGFFLLVSAGGFSAFINNLGAWRTNGVIGGAGQFTFPLSLILPGSALLLMISYSDKGRLKLACAIFLFLISLTPLFVMGFRSSIIPLIVSALSIWNFAVARIKIRKLILIAAVLLVFLVVFGTLRDELEGSVEHDNGAKRLLFRVSGLNTIERIIWRMDQGEPARGIGAGIRETLTIFVPRVIWSAKPQPASLSFADIFFFDYFLERGDSIESVRSGLPPTFPGELFWVGRLSSVLIGSYALGAFANILRRLLARTPKTDSSVYTYSMLIGPFALFAEAPQNTLNTYFLVGLFTAGVVSFSQKHRSKVCV